MKCSVFIATSVDGYIATANGGVDWLHTAGNLDAVMGAEEMGFQSYIDCVDCMVMGRKCMEIISSMNLSSEQWPYGDLRIVVLSNTVKEIPENLCGKIELYSGDIKELILSLENSGFKHAYIDGGSTITSFIKLELINEMTITQVPVLLGKGIPLFGKLNKHVKLENAQALIFHNDFIQVKYGVTYI